MGFNYQNKLEFRIINYSGFEGRKNIINIPYSYQKSEKHQMLLQDCMQTGITQVRENAGLQS